MTTDKGLQLWIPFVNDMKNQGILAASANGGSLATSGGKLGSKCLTNTTSTYSPTGLGTILNKKSWTMTMWIKCSAVPTNHHLFVLGKMQLSQSADIVLGLSSGVTGSFYGNDCTFANCFASDELNKWKHVVWICNGSKHYIYVDGVQKQEAATPTLSIPTNATLTFQPKASQFLQDFRIYSYALSPQEIKELSRGKIGHWLGDGNGTALPNLITGDYSIFKTSTGEIKTGTISSIPAATILANKGKTLCFSMRKYSKGARTNGTIGARFGIHWSCKYTRNGQASLWNYPMASLLTDASDGIVYCTWTIPSDLVSVESDLSPAIQAHGSSYARPTDAGVTWYITDVKLEWGTIPSAYSASNQAFLSDISGFGRHGQVVGNVTLAEDTPRYDKSLKYNGGNVVVTGLPTMSTYTISWWDKFPAGTGLLLDWRLGPVDTAMGSSSAGVLINNNTCQFKIGGVTTDYYDITANTWYHCCLVCDDSKSRLYINGIQKWEANKGSTADFSQLILGGRNAAANDGFQYTGQHSDFRIYATALSADDVKELYSLGH